jgi:hypothetical protein
MSLDTSKQLQRRWNVSCKATFDNSLDRRFVANPDAIPKSLQSVLSFFVAEFLCNDRARARPGPGPGPGASCQGWTGMYSNVEGRG